MSVEKAITAIILLFAFICIIESVIDDSLFMSYANGIFLIALSAYIKTDVSKNIIRKDIAIMKEQ